MQSHVMCVVTELSFSSLRKLDWGSISDSLTAKGFLGVALHRFLISFPMSMMNYNFSVCVYTCTKTSSPHQQKPSAFHVILLLLGVRKRGWMKAGVELSSGEMMVKNSRDFSQALKAAETRAEKTFGFCYSN